MILIFCNPFKNFIRKIIFKVHYYLNNHFPEYAQKKFNKIIIKNSANFYKEYRISKNYQSANVQKVIQETLLEIENCIAIRSCSRFCRPLKKKNLPEKNEYFCHKKYKQTIISDKESIINLINKHFDSYCNIELQYYAFNNLDGFLYSFGKKTYNLAYVFDIINNKINLNDGNNIQDDWELYYNSNEKVWYSNGGNHRTIATILTKGFPILYPEQITIFHT